MQGVGKLNEQHTPIYEMQLAKALKEWERKLLKPPGLMERTSKAVQTRINQAIPEKVHQTITAAVKGIVQTALFGIEYLPKGSPLRMLTLAERDHRAEELLSLYKKLAAAEGAGTGAGGIFLGIADFPLLISIKMKFLFELSHVYGHNAQDYRERLFILHTFQLAFSSPDTKAPLLQKMKDWPAYSHTLPSSIQAAKEVDWRQLQQEYRDTIDFRKMLQMLPGIGAVVGAWANYGLLEELGQTGMNAYRLRWIAERRTARIE